MIYCKETTARQKELLIPSSLKSGKRKARDKQMVDDVSECWRPRKKKRKRVSYFERSKPAREKVSPIKGSVPTNEILQAARDESPTPLVIGPSPALSGNVATNPVSTPMPPGNCPMLPGRTPTPPGRSPTPPGRSPTPPGRTLSPPGRSPMPPDRSPIQPGRSPTPPGGTLTPPVRVQLRLTEVPRRQTEDKCCATEGCQAKPD